MNSKTRLHAVTLLYKKMRHQVFVHSIPCVRDLLRLWLKESTEPLSLQVSNVIYDLAKSGRTNTVELLLCRPRRQSLPTDSLVPRFHAELHWSSGYNPPRIWNSVRLRHEENEKLLELKVLNVIHEIDQAGKRHAIRVQVI